MTCNVASPAAMADNCCWTVLPAGEDAFARLQRIEAAGSPFQSAAWLKAYLQSQHCEDRFRLLDLSHRNGSWLVMPLLRETAHGVCVLAKIGGAHASFFAPAASGQAIPPAALKTALREIAAAQDIDALLLADCPAAWQGKPHPLLALEHRAAPSDAALLHLSGPAEAIMAGLFDREGLKKQRYKRRKLGESGDLTTGWAVDAAEIEAALGLFFDWKAQQFAEMGVPDPFAPRAVRSFLHDATRGQEPPVRLFTASLDGNAIAVVGVARSGTHASGMFTAYNPRPDIARFSPGDVAMGDLIVTLRQEGCTGFDLGIGEARYKNQFCPEQLPIVDIAEGFTLRGQLAAAAWLALRGAKRTIKKNPRLFDLARTVRRRLRA